MGGCVHRCVLKIKGAGADTGMHIFYVLGVHVRCKMQVSLLYLFTYYMYAYNNNICVSWQLKDDR